SAIFYGCKWLTWRRTVQSDKRVDRWRSFAYLLAWPGMDAREFLEGGSRARPAGAHEWSFAFLKTLFGVLLVWGGVRSIPVSSTLLQGWVGLLGLVFMLHFGLFHLLASMWQHFGSNA